MKITMAPKGFGSENMSRVFMLKPADGIEGVKNAILTAVKDAGPNACPPMVVGAGIGGTFEKCALLVKGSHKTGGYPFRDSVCERPGRRNVTENQRAWNRTGRAWRNDHSACRQHQHLSDAHCRASCGSQYLLSCQPSCGTGTVETYFYRRKES